MMMASESLLAANPHPTDEEIRTGISGNLCRCTGYNAIVKAIDIAAEEGNGLWKPVDESKASSPNTLKEALILRKDSELIPYVGGTDLMVSGNCEKVKYLFLNNVSEMRQITEDEKYIRFGAACTFTETIEHPLTSALLREACLQIAAPAIRNAGSLGGNVANGSPKADSALVFMVTDSKLRLANADGERILPIKDFYIGGGNTALAPDEIIVELLMPKQGIDNFYHKKVGARNALSIARTSFAGILDVQDGVIANCAIAFGAVIDVIIRFDDIDKMLIGKTIEEAKGLKDAYISAYDEAIIPRRGRVGVEYRKDVCMNLLRDFLESNGI